METKFCSFGPIATAYSLQNSKITGRKELKCKEEESFAAKHWQL